MKHPRQHNDRHLDFVRSLPCVVCGNNIETEAAHIRMSASWVGKRQTGKGEKPDDAWTIPLCGRHHREQHQGSERAFWSTNLTASPLLPFLIALALWKASGDHEVGEMIVREWRL